MTDEPEIKKCILPDSAVDAIVKAEQNKAVVYEAESKQRLAFIREDLELRRTTDRTYTLMFKAVIYQSVLFTAAFVWWLIK